MKTSLGVLTDHFSTIVENPSPDGLWVNTLVLSNTAQTASSVSLRFVRGAEPYALLSGSQVPRGSSLVAFASKDTGVVLEPGDRLEASCSPPDSFHFVCSYAPCPYHDSSSSSSVAGSSSSSLVDSSSSSLVAPPLTFCEPVNDLFITGAYCTNDFLITGERGYLISTARNGQCCGNVKYRLDSGTYQNATILRPTDDITANFEFKSVWLTNPPHQSTPSPAPVSVGTAGRASAYGTFEQNGGLFELVAEPVNLLSLRYVWKQRYRGFSFADAPGQNGSGDLSKDDAYTRVSGSTETGYTTWLSIDSGGGSGSSSAGTRGFRLCSSTNPLNLPSFVSVGNPGNAADSNGFGSVGYNYMISATKFTLGELAEFLTIFDIQLRSLNVNSLSIFANTPFFNSWPRYGYTTATGQTTTNGYQVQSWWLKKPEYECKPAFGIDWPLAACICNWLHNRVDDPNTTNIFTGVYDVLNTNALVTERNPNARYWIPLENEWYKAAYYDPNKGGSGMPGYWNYSTRTDSLPRAVCANAAGDGMPFNQTGDCRSCDGTSTQAFIPDPPPPGTQQICFKVSCTDSVESNEVCIPVCPPAPPPPEPGEPPCVDNFDLSGYKIQIQYSDTLGFCPGGHRCDNADFDFYINGTLIGNANLNNGLYGGDVIPPVITVPTGMTADQNGMFTFELRCKQSYCHMGIAWIQIRTPFSETIVADTCIPNDTIILVGACPDQSSSSSLVDSSSSSLVGSGIFIDYTLGSAGAGETTTPTASTAGGSGGTTTATLLGTTLTANGGSGGKYNSATVAAGGTATGGTTNVTGGAGDPQTGDRGGGGGGATGGQTAPIAPNDGFGGDGAQSLNVQDLFSVLSSLSIPTTAPGLGANWDSVINGRPGGNATGFGCGGGGAGWYGGVGGAGRYGGGGGGAASETTLQQGGNGGQGVVVAQFISAADTSAVLLTSGSSHEVPAGATSVKIWAVGGGGGGGASAGAAGSAGGGGAGGVAYREFLIPSSSSSSVS